MPTLNDVELLDFFGSLGELSFDLVLEELGCRLEHFKIDAASSEQFCRSASRCRCSLTSGAIAIVVICLASLTVNKISAIT